MTHFNYMQLAEEVTDAIAQINIDSQQEDVESQQEDVDSTEAIYQPIATTLEDLSEYLQSDEMFVMNNDAGVENFSEIDLNDIFSFDDTHINYNSYLGYDVEEQELSVELLHGVMDSIVNNIKTENKN